MNEGSTVKLYCLNITNLAMFCSIVLLFCCGTPCPPEFRWFAESAESPHHFKHSKTKNLPLQGLPFE